MIRPLLETSIPAILAAALLGTAPLTSSAKDKLFESPGPKPVGIVAFVEGPAWHPTGNVYFSDGGNNRIMRRDRTGAMHVYRQPSGAANGLLFDFQGRLLACEGPGECVRDPSSEVSPSRATYLLHCQRPGQIHLTLAERSGAGAPPPASEDLTLTVVVEAPGGQTSPPQE